MRCASFFLHHCFSHPFFICQSRDKWVELKRFLDPLGFPPPFQHRRSSSHGHSGQIISVQNACLSQNTKISPGMPVQTRTVRHLEQNIIGGSIAPNLALAQKIPAGTEQNTKHCLTVQSSYSTYATVLNSTNSCVASGIVTRRPTTITTETRLIEITALLSFVYIFFFPN